MLNDQGNGPGQSESINDDQSVGVPSLTLDVVQDHPALWDWRLIVAFIFVGVASLYLL